MRHPPVNHALQPAGLQTRQEGQRPGSFDLSNLICWLDALAPELNEGIVLVNSARQIVYFSAGAERITGWNQQAVLGKSALEVFNFNENGEPGWDEPATPTKTYKSEVQHKDGFPITISYSFIRPPEIAQSRLSIIVFKDSREEDAAKKLRAFFIANITHEFRTPLSSLNASVEFLLEEIKYLSKSEIATLLTSVYLSVTGLQTLIDNLLESIQIEAGRFTISPRTSDLEKIIQEASRVMSPLFTRRQQVLRVTLPEQLPQLHCDPARMTQVLVNLLSNASKYGPTQQEILLDVRSIDASWIKVSISDHGPGIPAQERGKIFQQYYRLGAKSNAQDGVGLGLWVVRVIIEQHGGVVGVEDAIAGGSQFWFTMPTAR